MMERGFISSLFDFSFSEFITPKIVSALYMIGVILAGISALAMIFMGFTSGVLVGLLAIIVSPLLFFLNVIVLRLWLEIIIVLFKIYGGIRALGSPEGAQYTSPAQPLGRHSKLDIDF
jgi:hypothetical protein